MKWIKELELMKKKNGAMDCVALNEHGNLTTETSTGSMFKKQWRHVGESLIIGAETYTDNESYAVSCTGHGEYFMHHMVL